MKNTGTEKLLHLRPYQEDGLTLLRESFRKGNKRSILWMATGSGKTASFCELIHRLTGAGKRVLIVMRRREIVLQTARQITKFTGIKCSIIMGQNTDYHPDLMAHVCSIDTVERRMTLPQFAGLLDVDYLIVDEAHDSTSDNYRQFLNRFIDKFWIGLTATPFPTGKRFLSETGWQDIVCPITPAQLRDQGWLVPDRIYAPKKIDVSGIKITAGDYNQGSLAKRASESKIVGDIVETWKEYGENRPSILFAVNKEHSALMSQAFRSAGIGSIHQDESHTSAERAHAITELRKGSIKVLCNVNIFSTGVDIPMASCAIMARPTKSLILFLQQAGRVLRPFKICSLCRAEVGGEKTCRCGSSDFSFIKNDTIILDHANNCETHGLPYEYREAQVFKFSRSVLGTVKELRTKTCSGCYGVYSFGLLRCPYCDFEPEKKEREIVHTEGELALITARGVECDRLREALAGLKSKEYRYNWKPSAKYLMLYEEHGDKIFQYTKELELPPWLRGMVKKKAVLPSINRLLEEHS